MNLSEIHVAIPHHQGYDIYYIIGSAIYNNIWGAVVLMGICFYVMDSDTKRPERTQLLPAGLDRITHTQLSPNIKNLWEMFVLCVCDIPNVLVDTYTHTHTHTRAHTHVHTQTHTDRIPNKSHKSEWNSRVNSVEFKMAAPSTAVRPLRQHQPSADRDSVCLQH